MSFNSDIRRFATPADLAAHLLTRGAPDWPGDAPIGSTYHNTYRPTEAQWFGRASMDAMQKDYIAKGWSAGPHFYLALGSRKAEWDGIWQMTPPTSPGVHGVTCNTDRFGIEVVGDFNVNAPSLPQQQLLIDTLVVLHRWAHLGPNLNAHRDCVVRTCPGQAFYDLKPKLIAQLAARLNQAGLYVVRHTEAIQEAPRPDAPVALNDTAELLEGQQINIDEIKNGWAHTADGRGFVRSGVLTRVR